MKTGAFKPLASPPRQSFGGQVVDLSEPRPEARRILTPAEFAAGKRPEIPQVADPRGGEMHRVCIRPKEQTIPAIGPWGPWKLWPVQFQGDARIFRKPEGGIELQGMGRMLRQRAPLGVLCGWYLLGAPLFHVRLAWGFLRGRIRHEGGLLVPKA
jgi:hypothetical protein